MEHFANIDLGARRIAVGALGASQKAKLAPFTVDGHPLKAVLASADQPLLPLFPFRAYQDEAASRVSAVFAAKQDLAAWVQQLEAEVCRALVGRTDLLKQCSSFELVQAQLSSAVREGQSGPSVKFKLNKSGPRQVRCWDTECKAAQLLEDMRGVPCVPIAEAKCIWFSNAGFGIVWEVTDLQITDLSVGRCPFAGS